MSQQTRQAFLNQIKIMEAQLIEEERLNPTPKNILSLDDFIQILKTDEWERTGHSIDVMNGVNDQAVFEIDPETNLQNRYFNGSVRQSHRHIPTGIVVERAFDFSHTINEPASIVITPDEAVTWQCFNLLIQNGNQTLFNGYGPEDDNFSSDDNLDVLLKDHLTPEIKQAFDLSIEYNLMYQSVYTYIDDIKSEQDLSFQKQEANCRTPGDQFNIVRFRATSAELTDSRAHDYAFVGVRIAHDPRSNELCALYISYGGSIVWIDEGALFVTKNIKDIPMQLSQIVIKRVQDTLGFLHANKAQ